MDKSDFQANITEVKYVWKFEPTRSLFKISLKSV